MSNQLKIKIIHIEKPEKIFIKFLEGEKSRNNDNAKREVNIIQKKLRSAAETSERVKNPTINDIYGCYIENWQKWIRGKIISEQNDGFKVFCIDHGHYKTNVKEFVAIDESLKKNINAPYFEASLGLKPKIGNVWSVKAIDICKNLDKKKKYLDVHFVPNYEESNVFVGDLFIFDGDNHYSLTENLISTGVAEKSKSDFHQIFTKMHDKNIGPIKNVLPKKRLETYIESQHCEKNDTVKPNNMILYGNNNLRPAWSEMSETDFQHNLQRTFSNKNKSLNKIQKCVWPQICDNKHSVIISSNHESLTSTYLIPLLNSIVSNRNKRKNAEQLGPIAIIFASNASFVDKIAMQCGEYAKDFRIVKAVGKCKEKLVDILNGCDILIATLPAFIRLITNLSFKIIDENRLKWIIFNEFDQNSMQQFDREINIVMKLRYGNKNKLPQTVVTSKTVVSNMKSKILNYLPKEDLVLCIEDYLDAASYVGLLISIEIAMKNEDKLEKLLKSGINNFQKTVIVVGDNEAAVILEKELSVKDLKALNCESVDIAKIWDESNSNKCILIITDDILKISNIQNADNLVHFDLPTTTLQSIFSSGKFSSRFKIFANEIYRKLNALDEGGSLKTKILLSNENVDQFEDLINFLIARNLLKANGNIVVEKLYEKTEEIKCMKGFSLCSNLITYGKCKKFNCSSRHKLSEQDRPLKHLEPVKNFITFDLISVQGPTTFFVKVRDYYGKNNELISCVQSNVHIQQKLDIDMQSHCMDKKNSLAKNEGQVGEIYAKYDSNLSKWVRGKMIKRISSEIVTLKFLDYPTPITENPSIEESLQKLPQDLINLNPLVTKLQIMNFVPIDGEDSYSNDDVEKLHEYMKKIPKNAVFTSKICGIIGDVMFAKDVEAKNQRKSTVFRLSSAHSKLGFSEVDENVAVEILKLSSAFDTTDKNDAKVMTVPKINGQSLELFDQKAVIQKKTNVEYWKQLQCNKSYVINVKHYISPHSFLVVLHNPENLTLKNAISRIERSKDHKPLNEFKANDYCLFEFDGRNVRAKILSVQADETVEVLLVDYGDTQSCTKEKLFVIPDEFLNHHFQAIHCSMLGVRPKYNMAIWPGLQRSKIHELISEYSGESLKMLVVKKNEKNHKFSDVGISSYAVLLYDNITKCYLNKVAVERGIASECIEYNKDYHESMSDDEEYDSLMETSSSSANDSTTSDNCNELRDVPEELENLLKIYQDSVEKESKHYSNEKRTEDLGSTSAIGSDSSQSISKLTLKPELTLLKNMFKIPYIEWRQNLFMVYLLVTAKDCHGYALKINETSIDVIIKYSGRNKMERAIIQLYGSVIPKLCSHELAGNNIIVRLAKKCNVNWPRLTFSKGKIHQIKFSSEKIRYLNTDDNDDNKQTLKKIHAIIDDENVSNDDFDFSISSSSDESFFD